MKYIEFELIGDYALFSDIITRPGGEKNTYMVPTYEALKGAAKNCFWKPTINWVIDAVRVMNPIRTEPINKLLSNYSTSGKDLACFTYLRDVRYQVRAHFEWNMRDQEFEKDRNAGKFGAIIQRAVRAGGRYDIFLGTRECQAELRPCVFGEGEGYYDHMGEMELGYMYHGLTYPDAADVLPGEEDFLTVRFWRPVMKNGIITFIRPEECADRRHIRKFEPTTWKDRRQRIR